MTLDLDIYPTAQLYIEQHGADAAIHASMRADECLEQGDMDGQRAWISVVEAIKVLQQGTTP